MSDSSPKFPLKIFLDYRTTMIDNNEAGKALHKWFLEIFSVQNPLMAGDFDFDFYDDAGGYGQVIEIHSVSILFPVQALFSLFVDYNTLNPLTPPTAKFTVVK